MSDLSVKNCENISKDKYDQKKIRAFGAIFPPIMIKINEIIINDIIRAPQAEIFPLSRGYVLDFRTEIVRRRRKFSYFAVFL